VAVPLERPDAGGLYVLVFPIPFASVVTS